MCACDYSWQEKVGTARRQVCNVTLQHKPNFPGHLAGATKAAMLHWQQSSTWRHHTLPSAEHQHQLPQGCQQLSGLTYLLQSLANLRCSPPTHPCR